MLDLVYLELCNFLGCCCGTGTAPGNPGSYREPMKCYYYFQLNHGTARCSVLSLDKSKGAVKRIGKGFFLPDNSQIPWDSTRAIKQVVDSYGKQVHLAEVTTSYGQLEELEEPSLSLYE
ncbi:hypothetical protein VP01_2540g3, partial [Puccinia sorghi]